MRPEPKKKISTNAPQPGLNDAFAALELRNLPPGPQPVPAPSPAAGPQAIWKMGRVVLRRETARRGGKTVIVVHDFATHLPQSAIDTVAKQLRQSIGCGGAVKGRSIEMQGNQPAKIRAALEAQGFEVAGVV
jgi:translation initiation factor 1